MQQTSPWPRRAASWLICGIALVAIMVPSPGEGQPVDELQTVLEHLDRVSRLYRDSAMRFTADETIHYHSNAGRKDYRFQYFYVYEDGRLQDYRLPMGRGLWSPRSLEETELPSALRRAYLWIFLFGRDRWPHYEYSLLGRDDALDRPALKLQATPKSPIYKGVNEWFATAWIDVDSYRLLRVEGVHANDLPIKQSYERALETGEGYAVSYTFEVVTTEFGAEARGLRFPTEVVSLEKTYPAPPAKPGLARRNYLVRQLYSDYRFYDVWTWEDRTIHGEITPAPVPSSDSPPAGLVFDATVPDVDPGTGALDTGDVSLEPDVVESLATPDPTDAETDSISAEREDASEVASATQPPQPSDTRNEVPLKIVEPSATALLWGETEIVADLGSGSDVSGLVFFLDAFPAPICRVAQPPYTCSFDAGGDLQSHLLRVEAQDRNGEVVGRDSIRTAALPAPVRVERYTLQVPVVVSTGAKQIELDPASLGCRFGGDPCTVVATSRLAEIQRHPVSLRILIDVSASMQVSRYEVLAAIKAVIETTPLEIEISLAEFAEHHASLCRYTSDRAELQRAVNRLSTAQGRTCLFRAMHHSLTSLGQRPGHRLLFVITDGLDTCRPVDGKLLPYMNYMYDTVQFARLVSAPVYAYTTKAAESTVARKRGTPRSTEPHGRMTHGNAYESIATETGGLRFQHGELYGLQQAFEDLAGDLTSTWVVDIDVSKRRSEGTARLVLETSDADLTLRYPEYAHAGDRLSSLLNMLESPLPDLRYLAAAELGDRPGKKTLKGLNRSFRDEAHLVVRGVVRRSLARVIALMLLHGELSDQRAAVAAAEKLRGIDAELTELLRPAFAVYVEMPSDEELKRRAASLP